MPSLPSLSPLGAHLSLLSSQISTSYSTFSLLNMLTYLSLSLDQKLHDNLSLSSSHGP